ncbi:hypothetical protein CXF80_05110 [Shewanella sp. Actino-trap-3]|uniref:hypothetical protein n=1 Tax=Shewanella sp. S1-49-MNA-CIBAN-0167 TaxID=3140468 RepID=UPI000C33E982|nr:hypothetical protein CXF80_05110 [Shewanella sp. Actino-trap-3]
MKKGSQIKLTNRSYSPIASTANNASQSFNPECLANKIILQSIKGIGNITAVSIMSNLSALG